MAELNRVLRGWANYFAYGTRLMAYRAVDHYVWERVAVLSAAATQGPLARDEALLRGRGLRGAGRASAPALSSWVTCACSGVKPVREPDAGKPHVRFDEEGRETRDGPLGEWTPDPKGRKQWGAAGPVHDRARPSLYPVGATWVSLACSFPSLRMLAKPDSAEVGSAHNGGCAYRFRRVDPDVAEHGAHFFEIVPLLEHLNGHAVPQIVRPEHLDLPAASVERADPYPCARPHGVLWPRAAR